MYFRRSSYLLFIYCYYFYFLYSYYYSIIKKYSTRVIIRIIVDRIKNDILFIKQPAFDLFILLPSPNTNTCFRCAVQTTTFRSLIGCQWVYFSNKYYSRRPWLRMVSIQYKLRVYLIVMVTNGIVHNYRSQSIRSSINSECFSI